MNTFRTELVRENGKYYVTPLGSRIEVDGETGENLAAKAVDGAQLVVRVPTLGLRRQERAELVNGAKIHVSFPGEVMHLFDPETERNLIYG